MTQPDSQTTKRKKTKATTELVYLERILLNQLVIIRGQQVLTTRNSNKDYAEKAIEETFKTLQGEYDV